MKSASQIRPIAAVFSFLGSIASAGPNVPAGDLVLRQDIQRLADYNIISGPTSTWPLAWGPILEDLSYADASSISPVLLSSLIRVRDRAERETRVNKLTFNVKVGVVDSPARTRSFQNTPRGKTELAAGVGWIDDWFGFDLNVQSIDSDQNPDQLRADDSMLGVVVGNWSVAVSTQQRWWGPGTDGSLILSNNARPIPSLVIDRVFTNAFENRLLSWIGPWNLSVFFGQMERERAVPNTQLLGMRLNFRPLSNLEIGLSRTAQWCGDGRPCDVDTFVNLVLGNDNRGDAGIDIDNEPGNQLAGVDLRWSPGFLGHSIAAYGQFIGEDEAGGFPSRWMGQVGAEWSGYVASRWTATVFAEFAGTTCQFYESSEIPNCAYNHSIYRTGYRFRLRSIGHSVDNDARVVSAGITLVDASNSQWRGLVRYGGLNRIGTPDVRNSLTATRQDIASIDVSHSRVFSFGLVDAGLGYERVDDEATGTSSTDGRFYLQWRRSY